MLKELRKISRFGNKNDLIFFLSSVIGDKKISRYDINKICHHASGGFLLNADALLEYCLFLELLTVEDEFFSLTTNITNIIDDANSLNDYLVEHTISRLFDGNIFDADMFIYDTIDNRFVFKNERLSLDYSALRNLLISQGFFEINRSNIKSHFSIAPQYESLVSSFCRKRKKAITMEQLRKHLEENEEAGEKAELFALAYEKKRITNANLVKKIKQIGRAHV